MANPAASASRKGPLEIGEQFLKFQILGLLGKGGHAWVYHGYDQFLDRHVAIKVIPNPAEPGRDLRQRAQMEARVLCRLQHPNVVHVIDAGATNEGGVYIVMEILHGRTLRDVIHDFQALRVSEVLSIGMQIADGVQAAHQENAIHRDLKPENIFILKDNVLKVLDFGIAKFLGYGAKTTQRDVVHGTMLYMSPEHLQGFGVTVRSDIYALGTVLYEAFVGRPPCMIGVNDPTVTALAWSQINRMPPPLDELTGAVPRFIARTIQRMIAKEPADRFASMTEVADLLRANWRRYAEESAGAMPPPRQLWEQAPQVGPPSETRKGHATTEIHELAPSSALNGIVGGVLSGDTVPVTRPPHSVSSVSGQPTSSAAEETAQAAASRAPTLIAVPGAPSNPSLARDAAPAGFKSTLPSASRDAPLPSFVASQSEGFSSASEQLPPPPAPASSPMSSRGRSHAPRFSPRNVIVAAVLVGGGIGAVSGVLGALRHRANSASGSTEERIVIVSATPAGHVPTATETTAASSTDLTAVPPPPVANEPEPRSELPKPPVASALVSSPGASALAHPAAHATAADTAALHGLPKSGLWDMSDLDSKTKPTATKTPKPTLAAPKQAPKPIFGADDIK